MSAIAACCNLGVLIPEIPAIGWAPEENGLLLNIPVLTFIGVKVALILKETQYLRVTHFALF